VRVLVVHPPLSVASDFIDYPYASDLGAAQLAAALRERSEVLFLDAFAIDGAAVARRSDGRIALGAAPARLAQAAARGGPYGAAVIAATPFHRPPLRDDLLGEVCRSIRGVVGSAPVLLADCYQSGQHYVEAQGDAILGSYPEVDAVVKYEAERTVLELLGLAERGSRPRGVRSGEEVDLGALPPPAWDLVDLSARDRFHREVIERIGRGTWPFRIDGRTLPLVTSRGCPYRCLHCSSNPGLAPGASKRQRRLPGAALARHLEALVRRCGATRLFVLDEMLNADAEHFEAVLGAAEALGVPMEIPNGLRADRLSRAQLERLRGRISTLSVSAESGVQRVVDEVVGKRLDLSDVERVAEGAKAVGLPLMVHFIIGLPGETADEVNATLAYALDLRDRFGATPAVQFAAPLPGTRLAEAAAAPRGEVDWGPSFQARPSATNPQVPPETLERFRWAFDQRLRAAPEKLIVNLTYRCNNRCAFCAVGNRVQRDGDLARQRDLLARHRAAGVKLVDFDGGEPTLSEALFPLVGEAVRLGYQRIAVTTNGRRCSYEAYARRLARCGATTLLVSLHGPDREMHGSLVGVPEAFDQTVEGIRNLLRWAPPALEVGVNVTVARANADRLEDLAALVNELGVRWLNFQFLTPFGRATRDQAPDLAKTAERLGRVLDAWDGRLRLGVVNLPFCFMPGRERFLAPDLGKLGRQMVFVNDEEVNLAEYLAARRVRREGCGPCPYAVCCAGFYELDDVPEPPWSGAPAGGTGANSPPPNRAT
jgi:MoaA/NifB/PqqE/SkfB family radical SAM enzyme